MPDEMRDRAPLGVDLARRLGGEIIRARLAPGEKLVETEICAQYGVSRSPLREALGILEGQGLVTRKPRYGVRVALLSVANLDDVTTCRLPLEARAAALVASVPEHRTIAALLESHLGRMTAAHLSGDAEACFTANLDLVAALHRANPNPVLGRILADLNMTAQRYRYLVYRHRPGTVQMLLLANARMIAAIRSGDGATAHAVTEAMVRDAWTDLRLSLPALMPKAAA